MTRRRVLLFVTDFQIGGTERQVVNLARGLQASEFEPQVGCFRLRGAFLEELRESSVRIAEFPIGPLWGLAALRSQRKLALYLRQQRIALVHSFGTYPNLFALPAARMARVRSVAAIRDTGDHLSAWRRRLQRQACALADRVAANAFAVREHLVAEGYEANRLSVIHNGIDVERFGGTASAARVRAQLGVPARAPLVAMLARLTGLKGAEYFLQAAALAAQSAPEARFLVVGDGGCLGPGGPDYRGQLEAMAGRLGIGERVVFAGFRTDVPELLQAVTVAVQPSLSEGLSNVVLEAMAAGLPVVATEVGGNGEMVEHGVSGLLVPPRDAGALAAAIGRLLAEPALARSLGAAGRRRAASCFSLAALQRNTTRLYREVLCLPQAAARSAALRLARPEARG